MGDLGQASPMDTSVFGYTTIGRQVKLVPFPKPVSRLPSPTTWRVLFTTSPQLSHAGLSPQLSHTEQPSHTGHPGNQVSHAELQPSQSQLSHPGHQHFSHAECQPSLGERVTHTLYCLPRDTCVATPVVVLFLSPVILQTGQSTFKSHTETLYKQVTCC